MISDYYIHQTDLVDISSLKFFGNFRSKYRLPIESRNLQLEQNKFPVFWHNLKNPCVYADRDFLGTIFPVFPVEWVPEYRCPYRRCRVALLGAAGWRRSAHARPPPPTRPAGRTEGCTS